MNNPLCHTAAVSKNVDTVVNGRTTHVDTPLGSVSCRFTQPKTSLVSLVSTATIEKVDAVIFTGPDYLGLVGTTIPIKLVTTDEGWSGTYTMKYPPRVYSGYGNSVHHVEFDVWKMVA
jgi:hypothetical protein